MTTSVPCKFEYKLINAENFLCVATLLQIIINSCTDINIDQYQIAEHFGVCIPTDYKTTIRINNIIRTDDSNSWGIIIKNNEINDFFKKYNIPLREEFIHINTIAEWNFDNRIIEYLKDGAHLICGYNYDYLYKTKPISTVGHVSLICGISSDSSITILDSCPYNPGLKNVKSEDLFLSIENKNNGIWKITSI